MSYRDINSEAVWKGETFALRTFKLAFEIDCGSSDDTFISVYRWSREALQKAKAWAGVECA